MVWKYINKKNKNKNKNKLFSFLALFLALSLTLLTSAEAATEKPNSSPSPPGLKLKVLIFGLNKDDQQLIFPGLSIKAAEKEKKLNEERIESLHAIAIQELSNILESLGYYHAEIHAELKKINDEFLAEYSIHKGEPTRIQSVSVILKGEGRDVYAIKKFKISPPLRPGMILTHSGYENFKHDLLGQALQLGYLDAIFEVNQVKINRLNHTADIQLILDTGRQYKIGDITFKPGPYPESYLKRFIPFKKNDPFTIENMASFQKALTDTDLFKKVRIDPMLNETTDHTVPLNIRLSPRPKNKYSGSIGFGTDVGPRGALGYERRIQKYPGHRFNFDVKGSKRKNQVNARYSIPGENPITDRLIFGYNMTKENYKDDKYSRLSDGSFTKIRKIKKWDRILSLHYLSETFRALPTDPKRESHFLLPTFSLVYTEIHKGTYFDEGFRASGTVRAGLDPLFSTTNVQQSEFRLKWIPLLNEETRAIIRGDFGATFAKKQQEIPLSLRYFTGGDYTVRGFGYKTLGPIVTDKLGNQVVVGGRYLVVGSIELERHVVKQLSAVTFFDTGNAMNNLKTPLVKSAGVGIRWTTPLGPFRLDVARPLEKGNQSFRFHVTFGMDL